MTDTRISAQSDTGTIYDLGYRHYEGVRRGRLYAFWSLFVESLRAIFGFGRPFRAKAAPFILVGLYVLPAIFQIAIIAFVNNLGPGQQGGERIDVFRYDNYFRQLPFLLILFCVAQAPELLARDQRYKVLPLYLTRAITRLDYSLARLAALTVSLMFALLLPMAALFGGRAFLAQDVITGFQDQMPSVIPGLASSFLIALVLATISLAISSFSPRRAYCAISLIAYFLLVELIPELIYEIGRNSDWGWTNTLLLIRPLAAINGATDWFFGIVPVDFSFFRAGAPTTDQYLWASVAMAVVAAGVLLGRYRRMSA